MNALIVWLTLGCAQRATPLSTLDRSDLDARVAAIEDQAEEIYTGQVRNRDGDDPLLYTYQRWVTPGDASVASHVTRSLDGVVAVLQEASTGPDGRLRHFAEWHDQIGLIGTLDVDDASTATFDVTVEGERTVHTEPGDLPVHAGPSLFAFALAHWDELLAGETVPFRFPVLDDTQTYRFELDLEQADDDLVIIRMRASRWFTRLAVPSMAIAFDTAARVPVRYEGLVPPFRVTSDGLRPLDARVDYTLTGVTYR